MSFCFPLKKPFLGATAFSLVATLAASPVLAGEDVQDMLRQMNARLQQLEQRNQALEQEVKTLRQAAAPAPAAAARIEQLEQRVKELAEAPHEHEAGGASGVEIGGSFVAVHQKANKDGVAAGNATSATNYRGDVEVSLPAGTLGGAQGTAFAHVRFGQGGGLGLRNTHVGVPNSLAFEQATNTNATREDSFAILAQAHYTLTWPLAAAKAEGQPGDRVELTVGKMDFFGFFDQNEAAGDEASQFLNNAFVHNALLDTGGDIAADNYGFAPGMRLAYYNEGNADFGWGASLGVFASGNGANFSDKVSGGPLTIVQFEVAPKQADGEKSGNYRLYAWTNGRTQDLNSVQQRHGGWGISADQKVAGDWNLFGRYGKRTSGDGAFDTAFTAGFELAGASWNRGEDAVGLGLGWLKTGQAQQIASGIGGKEKLVELYYRAKLNEQIEVSPHVQYIRDPEGDASAPTVKIFGLRAGMSF
ncbi:MAG: carbohydrate porin [Pseudomonadota bacterium]